MGKDVNSVINTCFLFCPTAACQGFFRTKWSTTEQHQMRLLLQNPGGTFLQIQTDI